MSYDLMVFRPEAAPKTRTGFIIRYHDQTKWAEGHSYNDPVVASGELRSWFTEMITIFLSERTNGNDVFPNIPIEIIACHCAKISFKWLWCTCLDN